MNMKSLFAAALFAMLPAVLPAQKPLSESLFFYSDYDSPLRIDGKYYPMELHPDGYVPGYSGKGYFYRLSGYNQYEKNIASATDSAAFQNTPLRRIKPVNIGVTDMMDSMDLGMAEEKSPAPAGNPAKLVPDKAYAPDAEALAFENEPAFPGRVSVVARKGSLCVKPVKFTTWASWRTQYADALTASVFVKGKKGAVLHAEVAPSAYPGDMDAARTEWLKFHQKENASIQSLPPFQPDAFYDQKIVLTGEWQRIAAYAVIDCRLNSREAAFNLTTEDGSSFRANSFQFEVRPPDVPEPAEWMAGKESISGNPFTAASPDLMKKFPEKEGAMVFRLKYPANTNLPSVHAGPFLQCGNFMITADVFSAGGKMESSANAIRGKDRDWQMIALVWDSSSLAVYRNGKRILNSSRYFLPDPKLAENVLLLGYSGFRGNTAVNAVLDDVMIFNRSISPDEVAELYSGKEALLAHSRELLGTGVYNEMFYRNENPARLSCLFFAPADMEISGELKIDGISFPVRKYTLKKGRNLLFMPFEAWKFESGEHPYSLTFHSADGTVCSAQESRLKIFPATDLREFPVLSWGGSKPVETEFLKMTGINTVHIPSDAPVLTIQQHFQDGFRISPNLGNSGDFAKTKFDRDAIASRVRDVMTRFSSNANWNMTLCNTEVYGLSWLDASRGIPRWVEYAEKKLGFPPLFDIFADTGIKRPKDWKKPKNGIFDDSDPETKIWRFMMSEGQGPMLVNKINGEVIHEIAPWNIVWSEPMVPGCVDLTASWEYDYATAYVLFGLKSGSAAAHRVKCGYMPTLSMSYYPPLNGKVPFREKKRKFDPMKDIKVEDDFLGEGTEPPAIDVKEEKKTIPVELAQTEDELIIKTYLAIGAVRSEALSLFALDAWPEGSANSARENPEPNKVYADKNIGKHYGKMMYEVFRPMAKMLSGVDSAKSPVAVFLPETSAANALMGWAQWHFMRKFQGCFGAMKLDFDVLGDDATAEELRSYGHIFFPCAAAVMRSNYEKLLKTGETSVLYTDLYCAQEYPNAKRYDDPADPKKYDESLKTCVKELREKLKPELDVWADGTDSPLFTARRVSGTASYFLIVNDARTTGALNQAAPEWTWYKPYGKAQTATISLRIPEKSVVYDFVTGKEIPYSRENGRAVIRTDFAPAQGMLLCVYPSKFKDLELAKPEFKEGENFLTVTLRDEKGTAPEGRQLVYAELSIDGKVRDESGLYVLKNGVAKIPVYLKSAADGKRITLKLTERTSNLTKTF